MPEGVTTATHLVTLNSSGFRGIHNGMIYLAIIDVHARTELYFIVHISISCEMKIYHIVSCMNPICCSCCIVICTLCVFRLCADLKTNLFISSVLSDV
jgi:hypothetical protein